LFPAYFGNYRRLVYLSQAPSPGAVEESRAIAGRMGLAFEHHTTGYGDLASGLRTAVAAHEAPVRDFRHPA
jgi:hypothetical protein